MNLFDAHLHIVDPRYPLVPNQGFLPEPFTAQDYLDAARPLGVTGGAVVSGSFQAFDQSYLVAALAALHDRTPESAAVGSRFVGVTQLPASTSDDEIRRLDAAGVRAVRFNLRRGGSAGVEDLGSMARRVFDLVGWHVELYVDALDLDEIFDLVADLPRVVVDHLGLSSAGLPTLRRLVERGVFVKATGFGRLDFDPVAAIRELLAVRADAVVFGTDLPSTRAPRPFDASDIERIRNTFDADTVDRILRRNGETLYRLETARSDVQ